MAVPIARTFHFNAALAAALACMNATGANAGAAPSAWADVPGILKRIVPPKFPAREFVVTKFGAVGDGTNDCSQAFADAIAACAKSGGGRVLVPAGKFLTGAI